MVKADDYVDVRRYTVQEIGSLALDFADGNDATANPMAPDAVKLRLYLGAFVAWLSHLHDAPANLLHFEAREEG